MLLEQWEERLKWLRSEWYTKHSSGSIFIKEKNEDGEAEVEFIVNSEAISFNNLEGNGKFSYLQIQKCADGVILENKEDKWNLHIIECKKTINHDKWLKVKTQFIGALLRTHALLGILGIKKLEKIVFYTAFRDDTFNARETKNPALLKLASGQSYLLDWEMNKISLLSLNECNHVKVNLNFQGKGIVNL